MVERPVIALIIDTSMSWGRNIIRGIRFFTQEQGLDWVFCLHPWGTYDRVRLPRKWKGDGIIARITHESLLEDITKTNIPAVNVSTTQIQVPGKVVHCTVDEYAVGKLAAEHFLERGFENFGYCSYPRVRARYEDLLARGFVDAVAKAGFGVSTFCHTVRANALDWEVDQRLLMPWLCDQPKPLAMMTWNSVQARQVTEACRRAALTIPEQVAVLAGDYDDVMCDTATPPLSAVDLPARQIGYSAARLLHEMLQGRRPESPYLLQPNGITARQSTDSVAVDDPELAMALSYLRNHASEYINVSTVLRHVPIGRRSFEQQCQKLLGRSPAAEIRRIRLMRAAQLLAETKLSINQVARNSGFGSPDILLRNFRREYGVTPTDYRRQTNKAI